MSCIYNFKTFFLNILQKYLKYQNMALVKANPINEKTYIMYELWMKNEVLNLISIEYLNMSVLTFNKQIKSFSYF